MKKLKFIYLAMAASFALSITACNTSSSDKPEGATEQPASEEVQPQENAPAEGEENTDSLFHDKDAVGYIATATDSQLS
ncbi:MAG: hypothetical protein RIS47_443 [Bacteroidota bacterium]|jgi:hypothetical protein